MDLPAGRDASSTTINDQIKPPPNAKTHRRKRPFGAAIFDQNPLPVSKLVEQGERGYLTCFQSSGTPGRGYVSRNVIGYTRVSTRGQSLDAQVDALVAGGAIKVTTATEREAGELNGDMYVLEPSKAQGGPDWGNVRGWPRPSVAFTSTIPAVVFRS
ncbi:hypothetical protein [Pseudarthrobacter oxydans]|uniref:hypothetical protein n=1 Tax=Pseudarthrobacter oxydans TaxID=1671 RepID=UPI0035E8DBFB